MIKKIFYNILILYLSCVSVFASTSLEDVPLDTNKPNYLLKDELITDFNNGPISKVEIFGTYRGGIDYKWNDNQYDTIYDNLNPEVGFIGTFKNSNWGFKTSYFPWQQKGQYMRNFFSDIYIVNKSVPHHQIYTGYSRVNVGHEGGAISLYITFCEPFTDGKKLWQYKVIKY